MAIPATLHPARVPAGRIRIGIDFDNTIVCYDEVFGAVAREENLLSAHDTAHGKTGVRAAVRALPDGEYQWQRLQGLVYGRLIGRARLFAGVMDFFSRAAQNPAVEMFIVSHKTHLAHHDPEKTSLHTAAFDFLETNRFFDTPGFSAAHVFLEATREDKLARIAALRCGVFIDDLPEVLLDPAFPSNCERLLFSQAPHDRLKAFSSWQDMYDHLFRPPA